MNEINDPVLDALRGAARVQDADLDTDRFRSAIAQMVPVPRRRLPARQLLVAATVAAVVGVGGWQALAPSDDPTATDGTTTDDLALVAAEFDAVAAKFPLPQGQTYDALRATVLSDHKGEGEMPSEADSKAMRALVARYSGCKWWQVEQDGSFDKLSRAEQAEIQSRNRHALTTVLKTTDNPARLPMTEVWDVLCQDQG